jgi:sugar lactone lactonase YvrE
MRTRSGRSARPTVRKVDAQGIITTVLADGTRVFDDAVGRTLRAQIGHIAGITVDSFGNVYFIDIKNNRVGKIAATGLVTFLAGPGVRPTCVGRDGGPFTDEGAPAAQLDLCGAEHLSVDQAGNIFVADTYNHRIVMIDARGIVTTLAGTGTDSFSGDGGRAETAELSEPSGVTVGPDGSLYISDSGNHRVRSMTLQI